MIRSEMRTNLRRKIGEINTAVSDQFTDAELNQFLYDSALEVQSIILDHNDEYFTETNDFSVTASQTELTLPDGFESLIDLRRIDSNNNIQFKFVDQRVYQREYPLIRTDYRYKYYLSKDKINYYQAIGETHTARLTYVKRLEDLDNDDSEWVLPLLADQWIVVNATINALASENSKSDQFNKERQRLENRLILNAIRRVRQRPRYVHYHG